MRKSITLINIIIGILFLNLLVAQSQEPVFKYSLDKYVEQGKVILRWAPVNTQSWYAGNKYGYKLTRYTLKENGVKIPDSLREATKLILLDSIKPLPEAEWEAKADSNQFAGVAAGAIYGDSFDIEDLSDNPNIRAINRIKEAESRHAFALMAADMDLQVAKDLGLAYNDTNDIISGRDYLYIVTLAGEFDSLVLIPGTTIAIIDEPTVMETIDSVYAYAGDKIANIGFSIPVNPDYVGYQIERSSDGGQTYIKINSLPIVPVYDKNTNNLSILDTLADNTTEYIYRVRGINSFGMIGPESDTIHVKGKIGKKLYYALIDEGTDLSIQGLKINWEFVNVDNLSDIEYVDVYRSDRANEDYVKINNSPINPTQKYFIDASPKASNYYKLKFYDLHGYEYESIHSLAQKEDSIAPSIPINGTAKIDKYGNITLKWAKNSEPDMYGYKVYMSNYRDSLYQQVHGGTTRDSFFNTTTDLNTLTKKLYFKLTSEDNRHNISGMSEAIEVTRPDIVPPSAPIWGYSHAAREGINLSFITSTSDDVAEHKLMRRNKGSRYWTTIYTVQGVQNGDGYLYIDSAVTLEYIYQYRVVAYDQDGNFSFTSIIDIRAFDTGIRGTITDLEIQKVSYDPAILSGIPDPNKVYNYPSSVNVLTWAYTWPQSEVFSFEIYRSIDGDPFRVYDVVYVHKNIHQWPNFFNGYRQQNKFFYIDLHMLAKHTGVYGSGSSGGTSGGGSQGGGGNNPGGNGGQNNPGGNGGQNNPNGPYASKTYTYKVIAHHKDGSTSRISLPVNVSVN
ncbi:MAG: hypothetical protein IT265_05710 [Saprospiraceae bacterium]|nr:hypothetical protein [Saprospiraceae bacterium]